MNMAVGIFSVGALVGMMDLQLSQMDVAHTRSNPSHINFLLRSSTSSDILKHIQSMPDILGLDAITQLTVRFRLSSDADWETGTLFIRPDYLNQHYDITSLNSPNWPEKGQIAMENLSAQAMPLALGSSIEFETPQGSTTLKYTSIVRHPFVKPPKFGGQLHFFADSSTLALFGLSPTSFRQLLVQVRPPFQSKKVQDIALNIRDELAQHGVYVNATFLQDPHKHWGRPFLLGIHYILTLMAISVLILASALTVKTVSAHIIEQIPQIGVMKAIGAKTSAIAYLYLTQIFMMAVIAILIALPLGVLISQVSSCKLLTLFNIACEPTQISWKAVQIMIISGLVTPLIAAMIPIVNGARMPVHQALATQGLMGKFGLSCFDVWIQKIGPYGLSILQSAALGNLFRHKLRFILTQSVLISACMVFLLLMCLIASLNLTLDNEMQRHRYAVRLGFSQDQPTAQIQKLLETIDQRAHVEIWRRLPVELIKNNQSITPKGSLGLQLLALPSGATLANPAIENGRSLYASDAGERVLLISSETAQKNAIHVNDTIDVHLVGMKAQLWKVVGTYRWLAGNNFTIESVYAPLETIQAQTDQSNIATYAFIDTPILTVMEEKAYLSQLKALFNHEKISLDAYTTQGKREQREFAQNQFHSVIGTFAGLASLIAAVGGISLSGTLALNVLQRKREIGVLRAIGASEKDILHLFWFEGFFHAAVAWLCSAPLAYFVSQWLCIQLGDIIFGVKLDFCFDWYALLYCLIGLLLIVCVATYFPARQASQLTIKEALSS
jgi:putative ABC transport system permease protein